MDLPQLVQVLQGCLSENPAAAVETLNQFQTAPGQAGNLLRVAVEESVNEGVRQMAAIEFKNLIKRHWEVSESANGAAQFVLAEGEKQVVRDNLVECLIRSPHKVAVQLSEALKLVTYADFPEKWPGLLPALQQNLTAPQQERVFGGLNGFRWLCRKYQLADDKEQAELEEVVKGGFPVLLQLLQQLVQDTTFSPQAAEAVKLICKCFYYVTYLNVPAVLGAKDTFMAWMTVIHAGVLKHIPKELQPADEDERSKWCWWKAKKWLFRLSYRLLMRNRPTGGVVLEDQDVATTYMAECLPKFVEAHLQVMADYASGHWQSPQVMALNLQFLSEGVKLSPSYKLMAPVLPNLVSNVIFPLTFFNAQDHELWVNDPHEYVRRGYEALETMYDVKVAAVNFIQELCQNRPKAHLDKIMAVVLQALNTFAAERAAGAVLPETAARMDGALLIIGSMYALLRKKKAYRAQLEAMLMTHIAPCFASPFGFLRAKACWVAGAYADIDFSNEAHFYTLFESVIKAMSDPELPVRVDAGTSLKDFVGKLNDTSKLKTILEPLMNNMFALMREVDSEELVATVETIIENVGEEIVPYALTLCRSLVSTLMMYSDKAEEDDADDDFIAEWAAFGCVRAINTLLSFLDEHPALFVQLEEVCHPVMDRFLSSDGQDMLEDVLEMLTRFTFCLPALTPRLWSLWPKLHSVVVEFGVDFWDAALKPLDNLISRGTEHFLTCQQPDYRTSVYQMVESSLQLITGDKEDSVPFEDQLVAAPQLLNVVLQVCRGHVDQWVDPYLKLAVAKLHLSKERVLQDALMSVVANAILYNPTLALSVLQQMGAVGYVFTEWFKMILAVKKSGEPAHFKSLMDKKVGALALSSLLTVPDNALPPEIAAGLSQLTPGILKLLINLKQHQERKEQEAADEDEDEADGEEEDDDEGDMEDRDGDPEGDAYLKRLEELSKQYAAKAGGGKEEEEDDDDDDDYFEADEDDVSSPLDPINPYVYFAQRFSEVQTSMPARYQLLLSRVDQAAQQALQAMMLYAQQQLQEQATQQQAA